MDNDTGRLWMVCEATDPSIKKDASSVTSLSHKNLVRYVVSSVCSDPESIFSELCSGGPLSNLLETVVDEVRMAGWCTAPSLSPNLTLPPPLTPPTRLLRTPHQGREHPQHCSQEQT